MERVVILCNKVFTFCGRWFIFGEVRGGDCSYQAWGGVKEEGDGQFGFWICKNVGHKKELKSV